MNIGVDAGYTVTSGTIEDGVLYHTRIANKAEVKCWFDGDTLKVMHIRNKYSFGVALDHMSE